MLFRSVENCAGTQVSFTVAGTSAHTINYQWQVSTNVGATFSNINGANTASHVITNVTTGINNNLYRCILTNTACATASISNAAKLTVRALPTITLTAAPITTLLPGQTTLLTAATSPSNGGSLSTNWFYNTAPISVTANTYPVSINQAGNYYATITETYPSGLQCSNTSATVTITAAESSKLFIFPSPSNGSFTVSYYNSSYINTKRSIAVYDTKGALVYKKEFTISNTYSIQNVTLVQSSTGYYMVVLFDADGKKIIEGKVLIK